MYSLMRYLLTIVVFLAGVLVTQAVFAEATANKVATTTDVDEEVKFINIAGRQIEGNPEAVVVIVEFADFQCPACGRQARDILPEVRTNYIEAGTVAYVYMNLPLPQVHPLAFRAAEAGNCAAEQGHFWEMHDLMFSNQSALREDDLFAYAATLPLDLSAFQDCMVTGKTAAAVQADMDTAAALGARRTPSIFLTVRESDSPDQVRVSQLIVGVSSYSNFKTQLDRVLAETR